LIHNRFPARNSPIREVGLGGAARWVILRPGAVADKKTQLQGERLKSSELACQKQNSLLR
jgi:hypothetical protein